MPIGGCQEPGEMLEAEDEDGPELEVEPDDITWLELADDSWLERELLE